MKKTLRTFLLISALFTANVVFAQGVSNELENRIVPINTPKKVEAKTEEIGIGDRIIQKGTQVLEKAGKTFNGIIDKYSKMMQVSPNSITNVILYQFVDDWYGTRYCLGGTGKKGIDCSALVQKLYTSVYGMDVVRTSIMQFRNSEYVANKSNLNEGDLVFFRIHGGPVSHVGIYLKNNYFVHASSSRGVMVSNLEETYWTKYYVGGGKMK
jgi:cell wall-associated NlpC family hydrolase